MYFIEILEPNRWGKLILKRKKLLFEYGDTNFFEKKALEYVLKQDLLMMLRYF